MVEEVNFRELREASGLTLVELAARAGVARQTLHRMEAGVAVKAATAAKVAKVLLQESGTSVTTTRESTRREQMSQSLSTLTDGLLHFSELPLSAVTELDESDLNRLLEAVSKAQSRILDTRRKIQRAKELAEDAEEMKP
jgi:transcriptional regulator with XRE-family HTH domain